MKHLYQSLLMKIFSEDDDHLNGPEFLKYVYFAASFLVNVFCLSWIVLWIVGVPSNNLIGLAIAGLAIMSGFGWHLNLKGKSKNLLAMAILGLIWYT
jgi:hypothetical protein